MRKGQGLPLNVVIIAVIVIVVAVVLITIFTGNIGKFRQAAESCATKGGSCEVNCESSSYCQDWVCTETRAEDCDTCCIKIYEKLG